jgi:hypothetical protein
VTTTAVTRACAPGTMQATIAADWAH